MHPGPVACIFMPWWGPAPGWEQRFLERASHSKSLRIALVGDAAAWIPRADVIRLPATMDEFEALATETAGVRIHKCSPRYPRGQAICELRCMIGDMYPGVLEPFEWWGYGDWDVVWGDWDSFLTEERLAQYDVISSNAYSINGCWTIFRRELAGLYRKRIDLMESLEAHYMEETGLQSILKEDSSIRVLYPAVNGHDRHSRWNRCTLRDGKLYKADQSGHIGAEIMKFHFPAHKKWPL